MRLVRYLRQLRCCQHFSAKCGPLVCSLSSEIAEDASACDSQSSLRILQSRTCWTKSERICPTLSWIQYPNMEISGPKYYIHSGFWHLIPLYLGNYLDPQRHPRGELPAQDPARQLFSGCRQLCLTIIIYTQLTCAVVTNTAAMSLVALRK